MLDVELLNILWTEVCGKGGIHGHLKQDIALRSGQLCMNFGPKRVSLWATKIHKNCCDTIFLSTLKCPYMYIPPLYPVSWQVADEKALAPVRSPSKMTILGIVRQKHAACQWVLSSICEEPKFVTKLAHVVSSSQGRTQPVGCECVATYSGRSVAARLFIG